MADHEISLEDDSIIFFAELVAIAYAGAEATRCRRQAGTGRDSLFAVTLIEALPAQIRALLQKPLRSSEFRKTFCEHFERHPNAAVRMMGWPWMQAQLTWDS